MIGKSIPLSFHMAGSPFDQLKSPAPEGAKAFDGFHEAHNYDDSPLSDEEIDRLWRNAGLGGIIRKMERQDVWAVDGQGQTPESMTTSRRLLARIAQATETPAGLKVVVDNEALIAKFMAHLRTGRAIALFRFLMDRSPAFAVNMLREAVHTEQDRFLYILGERIRVLEKSRVLSRVFSPERIASLIEALDDDKLNFK